MSTIIELYERYRIMPGLQLHQLRVASVAQILCKSVAGQADERTAVSAALLHDMGNILKADLSRFPEFLEPQGIEYWRGVKEEFHARYGDDEHRATSLIVREIGVPEQVRYVIEHMGFSRAQQVLESGPIELQIVEYADQRVSPHGVVSMHERLAEGRQRYALRPKREYSDEPLRFEAGVRALELLEARIFSGAEIAPADITEESIQNTVEALRQYRV